MSGRIAALALLLSSCAATPAQSPAAAEPQVEQRRWAEHCEDFDEWDKPGPPVRLYGGTYYVGTCGISAILVVSPAGHALIDSGTDKGAQAVLANVRALGFDPADIDVLLMSHEHFDHVGGMARLRAATGARLVASPRAAQAMRSGSPVAEDPQAGMHEPFAPVESVDTIADDAEILVGDKVLRAVFTPGHAPGATTWAWRECGAAGCKSIVYVDSLNPIASEAYRFSDHPDYLAAFRASLAKVAALDCDIVVAPHPSSANMRSRLLGAAPLIDGRGCEAYVAGARQRLEARLAQERDD